VKSKGRKPTWDTESWLAASAYWIATVHVDSPSGDEESHQEMQELFAQRFKKGEGR
jgi:hypothetical protein